MGHIRIGLLPKSKKWIEISEMIVGMYKSEIEIEDIAQKTIENVRSHFRHIEQDSGVLRAFQFLVCLAFASREEKPKEWLSQYDIDLSDDLTPFSFAKSVKDYVAADKDSCEYGEIAQQAAGDAISIWYNENQIPTLNLFTSMEDPFQVWRKAGNGAGFCELSRHFFSKFTQRYLNYYLGRVVSSTLSSAEQSNDFEQQLEKHVDTISSHAFETAKITQSLAAGWFNNRIKNDVPSEQEIKRFLSRAFGKLRDELQREGKKK